MIVKKHIYRILVAILVVILLVVSFYMLWVHIPYYEHFNGLDEIRNQICEKNNYEYMNYFNEHRGKSVYYVLKVKIDDVPTYVAYDEKLKLVNSYQGEVIDQKIIKNAILKKYKKILKESDLGDIEIGYENERFVYCMKVQDNEKLMYIYYDISDGSFVKTYNIGKGM